MQSIILLLGVLGLSTGLVVPSPAVKQLELFTRTSALEASSQNGTLVEKRLSKRRACLSSLCCGPDAN